MANIQKKEIEKYILNFNEGSDDVPEEIITLGLAVSYDMGWQKCSTGHRYDSMSGHGFIIGCRSGKIIGLDVKGKNVRNATTQTNTTYL